MFFLEKYANDLSFFIYVVFFFELGKNIFEKIYKKNYQSASSHTLRNVLCKAVPNLHKK